MELQGRKIAAILGGSLLAGALLAYAQGASSNQNPTPPRKAGDPIIRSNANLIALHDAKSRQYNPNCLASGCHADIFNRTVGNSSIRPPHSLVERMGLPATGCQICHQSTDIVRGIRGERGNAAKLGKNVDPEFRCYPCHGSLGPGKQLYRR